MFSEKVAVLLFGILMALSFKQVHGADSNQTKTMTSADEYKIDCENGNPSRCLDLGHRYEVGEGIDINYSKAVEFYDKACEGRIGRGCLYLGAMYYSGKGVEQDYLKARNYYQKGCDVGHDLGCYKLADIYFYGDGVKQDSFIAGLLYQKACKAGLVLGCEKAKSLNQNQKASEWKNSLPVSNYASSNYSSVSKAQEANPSSNLEMESPQQKQDDATCKSYGAEFGTDKYVSCRIQLEALHQATSASKLENSRAQTEQINQRQKGIDTMSCTDRANAYMNGKQLPAVSASTAILSGLMVNMDRQRIFSDCMKALGW